MCAYLRVLIFHFKKKKGKKERKKEDAQCVRVRSILFQCDFYHWTLLSDIASIRLELTRGLVKFLVGLTFHVSFHIKLLTMFTRKFCFACRAKQAETLFS